MVIGPMMRGGAGRAQRRLVVDNQLGTAERGSGTVAMRWPWRGGGTDGWGGRSDRGRVCARRRVGEVACGGACGAGTCGAAESLYCAHSSATTADCRRPRAQNASLWPARRRWHTARRCEVDGLAPRRRCGESIWWMAIAVCVREEEDWTMAKEAAWVWWRRAGVVAR